MSHDRGCFLCGEDRIHYSSCAITSCPKKEVSIETHRGSVNYTNPKTGQVWGANGWQDPPEQPTVIKHYKMSAPLNLFNSQEEDPQTDLKRLDYKWDEDLHLDDVKRYIDETYSSHYSTDKYQATDMIIDAGHGEGFCMGNIMKYAKRYGRKNGYNKKDLLKIIHYAIIMLHLHEENNNAD